MKSGRIILLGATIAAAACTTDGAKQADTVRTVADAMPAVAAASGPAPGPSVASSGMLDPNTATAAEMTGVPGVTAELAAAVAAGRPYASMLAVDRILSPKLDEKQRDSVYTRVWIPLDLNKATEAEMLLIPGVGPRMRREFEEYRPWTSREQFRREIGKYVDKDEVARLERYMALR